MTEEAILTSFLATNSSLTQTGIENVLTHFKINELKRNEILINHGQTAKHLYFIVKGCLRLYEIDKKGNEVTAYFAFENSLITALPSFILQKPSLDFLIAHEHSTVYSINRADFLMLKESYPEFSKLYGNFVEFAAIHTQMRIYSFLGMEGIDKLRWVMEHEPQLLQRVSSKAVATYLGMTNSTLSKLRAKL